MTDYINREAAIKAIERNMDMQDLYLPMHFIDMLNDVPAADVVEVVRCKDCKHSYDSMGGWCCSYGVCVDCIVPEDFFCKYGERKEGEG